MSKYKICPVCGTKNDPASLECTECEADLTRERVTDEETEARKKEREAHEEAQPASQPRPAELVRVCDCGQINAPNARKCSACGEDISDIAPTPAPAAENQREAPSGFVLASLDGQCAFPVPDGDTVLGRQQGLSSYLASKDYVSRSHARLIREQDALYIENLSGTNHTYINNERIMERTKLNEGDEIGLGGISIDGNRQDEAAYFVVRTRPCT